MSKVIRIISHTLGHGTRHDGKYVVAYDPSRDGATWDCHLVTTPNIAEATRFDDPLTVYQQVDQRRPLRPDGKPNRPLTAFTVEVFDPAATSSAFGEVAR